MAGRSVQLVIRGGKIVDGTGKPAFIGDVAVDDGRVVAVGPRLADYKGAQEVDAAGKLVLPGWVDIHTHYDGQATWDTAMAPSCWHGVTTCVFGNCGVGFAPVEKGQETYLINLMEGVEDIPGTVLHEGMEWGQWSTFPEYLDYLDGRRYTVDICAQIPHGAVRFFVMGKRGEDVKEAPTKQELDRMSAIVEEGLRAGALGVSTSRTYKHRTGDRRPTNMHTAEEEEILALAKGMGEASAGILQVNGDWFEESEFSIVRKAAQVSGRPVTVLLFQVGANPQLWQHELRHIEKAQSDGLNLWGQCSSRPISVCWGLESGLHPLMSHKAFRPLRNLPLAEKVERLQHDQELRKALAAEHSWRFEEWSPGPSGAMPQGFWKWSDHIMARLYELDPEKPDYEQDRSKSVANLAKAAGREPYEFVIDLLCKHGGRNLLVYPHENYYDGDLENVRKMLTSDFVVSGLSDAGAHCGAMADAGMPTYLISHWARDRTRGPKMDLEFLVSKQTMLTAQAYGLYDRGVLQPGFKADINVIDFDSLGVLAPRAAYDLPTGGRRLLQGAKGYLHTFVSGVETFRNGQDTGKRPGRLVRGAQRMPDSPAAKDIPVSHIAAPLPAASPAMSAVAVSSSL